MNTMFSAYPHTFNMCTIIILGKIKAIFPKNYFRNINAIVLVLQNVFIVSYGIAKCIREIIRESILCRY